MKLKVERHLTEGSYVVSFRASEFSDDERNRFAVFGAPRVGIRDIDQDGDAIILSVPVTELHYHSSKFRTEAEAQKFEAGVVEEIKRKMAELRTREDDFSSDKEVEI